MTGGAPVIAQGFAGSVWEILTFQAGYNTTIVVLGTTLLGMACGVIGSFLLLRKRSLVADALSHAALPGVAAGFILAVALGLDGKTMWILLPAAGVFGLLGVACMQVIATLPRVKEDAAIGIVLSVFFAIGIVLLTAIQQMGSGNQAGLKSFIFGQAAAMSDGDLRLIVLLAAIGVIAPLLFFKELRVGCFDGEFTRSLGWPRWLIDAILLGTVTLVTVAGLHSVGAILMVALLIVPAAAARFWTERLVVMVAIAAAVGGAGCYLGAGASAVAPDVPTGPAIVLACGGIFLVSLLGAPRRGLVAKIIERRRLARRIERQHLLRAMYECGEIAGDFEKPVTLHQLLRRRRWRARRVARLLRHARRRGEVERAEGAWRLTERGRRAAASIVRTHRLWEHFLTTQADVAPSHVDRGADAIEHVLGGDMIERLEQSLRARGVEVAEGGVPRSPHALASAANGGASR